MNFLRFGLFLLLYGYCNAFSESTKDDITCKNTTFDEASGKVTMSCKIRTNVAMIPCRSNWDTLHLEIFADQNQNGTTSLSLSLFRDCGHLKILAIWEGGPLTHLQRKLFQPLFNLQRLIIRAKNLQVIESNLLLFLPHLQLLLISDSLYLKRLAANTLSPLPSQMTTLDLSNNQLIDVLYPGMFGNHLLRNLYLQNNKINGLLEDSLLGLSELRLLRISGNRLSGSLENSLGITAQNPASALLSVPQLEILDLARNYLTEIVSCKWSGGCEEKPVLRKLRVLNLAKNRLTWLDPESFRGLPGLAELHLEGNPDLFHAGSIPVVLFSLKRDDYSLLKHLTIPQEGPGNGVLEMCSKDASQTGSRIIRSAIEHLSKQFCEEPSGKSKAINGVPESASGNSTDIPEKPRSEGLFFDFIRTAQRWVLTCIALGILLIGAVIAGIIFVCIYYGMKKSPAKLQEDTQEMKTSAILHAPSHMSLDHIQNPEGYRQFYFPIVQPLLNHNNNSICSSASRCNGFASAANGTPFSKSGNLRAHRNASRSVYSLLSAPPSTAAVAAGRPLSVNLIEPKIPIVKQAVV